MTNIPGFNAHLLSHNHEEADTLLILHAIDVARSDPFQKLIVQSPDTDVFLLLIYYQRSLCNHTIFKTGISFNYIHFKCSNKEPERGVKNFDTIFILTGRGKDIREIDVTAAYEAVGPEIASAILGFHAFSGCDFTSKFNNKSKKSCWKVFMESDVQVKNAFTDLTKTHANIDQITTALQMFILDLYCKNRPSRIDNLASLRWYMFSKYQHDSTSLPPTIEAFKMKILRSHLVTKIWAQSHLPKMNIPDPTSHGWVRLDDGGLKPLTTLLPPAPEAVIEMSLCRCKKSCVSKKCSCVKSGIVCTELCFCESCENQVEENSDIDSEHENQESYESSSDVE